ncbi:hypothetical protein QCE62_22465 [Caballeronia sp. LZ033]|uniref:hypothetical protein n=1 Tax=Caballeronia sp. LZ033 TaxID=3038566 RepID=UPI002861638B|nr:hypothetical protein [Caballeronia sp. LZ033]MDR5816362.1 hypothetical protein [Caballeronia sp. LZ033]
MQTNRIVLTLYMDEETAAASVTASLLHRLQRSVDHIVIERSVATGEPSRTATVLVAVLGPRDIMEFAHQLHDWLARNGSAEIAIGANPITPCRGLTTGQLHMLLASAVEDEHAPR